MSLPNQQISVLQPWVMSLAIREQGTLLTAARGCDLVPKHPLDSLERRLVAAIRGAFMVPADEREVDREPGSFISFQVPRDFRLSTLGHYPLHWVMHVVHACEVLGYRHPDQETQAAFLRIYLEACHALHLNAETAEQFAERMAEDRIASGQIVS